MSDSYNATKQQDEPLDGERLEPANERTGKPRRRIDAKSTTFTQGTRPKGAKANPSYCDLNATQRDMLWTLLAGPANGLEIKRRMDEVHPSTVNSERIYRNSDGLEEQGLISVDRQGRTNEYRITDDGRQALRCRQVWLHQLRAQGNQD